ADDGPVGLPARPVFRPVARSGLGGDRLEEAVRRRRELPRLHREPSDGVALAPAARLELHPDQTGLAVVKVDVVACAVAGVALLERPPLLAVVGDLNGVLGRVVLGIPVDDQAAELARVAEVDLEPLLRRDGAASPA